MNTELPAGGREEMEEDRIIMHRSTGEAFRDGMKDGIPIGLGYLSVSDALLP